MYFDYVFTAIFALEVIVKVREKIRFENRCRFNSQTHHIASCTRYFVLLVVVFSRSFRFLRCSTLLRKPLNTIINCMK